MTRSQGKMKERILQCMGLIACCLLAISAYAADGDAVAGKAKANTCIVCHGESGANPPTPEWPKIAGQHESYLIEQLVDYKQGAKSGRPDPTMQGISASLSGQDILDLAAYFAAEPVSIGQAKAGDLLIQGRAIYRGGIAEKGVPACMACHGPSGAGNGPALFPALRGQNAAYIASQLKAYRSGERKNTQNEIMTMISKPLSNDEISTVANYIQGLY